MSRSKCGLVPFFLFLWRGAGTTCLWPAIYELVHHTPSLSRFKKWQKCSEIFCMHSFRALIGQVVRRQNVICDTPTSLGAREQPDNLILTRLATNAGHRAMSNLHSTNLQSTIPPWSTTPSTPSTLPTWSPAQHLPDTNPRTCQVTTTTCSSKPGGEPNLYQPWSLPTVMQRQKSVFFLSPFTGSLYLWF